MKITVFGAGYVGVVTAACFAEVGHTVVCFDVNSSKIASLKGGTIPFFEPGLHELVIAGARANRLNFTSEPDLALANCEIAVIAVGTPQNDDGSTDISQVRAVAEMLQDSSVDLSLLLVKSTVPVGTNAWLSDLLAGSGVNVVSNPEFLREGTAVSDGLKPDRIVLGARRREDAERARAVYEAFVTKTNKTLIMSPESAELVKYAANSMLATRISFMNEIAEFSSTVGADIEEVRLGMSYDTRIGSHYLYAGAGFGGSCLPKDLLSLKSQMLARGIAPNIVSAVVSRNDRQIEILAETIATIIIPQAPPVVAIWGVAFKPNTDDIRESPSIKLALRLLNLGYIVKLADPVVEARHIASQLVSPNVSISKSELEAAAGADVLVLVTEWRHYRAPNFASLRRMMRGTTLIDGRNQWDSHRVRESGFTYIGIGHN